MGVVDTLEDAQPVRVIAPAVVPTNAKILSPRNLRRLVGIGEQVNRLELRPEA
jgi:hypothetical protein